MGIYPDQLAQAYILINLLNRERNLPIVAHYTQYDRDKVLQTVFERLSRGGIFPHPPGSSPTRG